jgi:hypothetical protein
MQNLKGITCLLVGDSPGIKYRDLLYLANIMKYFVI